MREQVVNLDWAVGSLGGEPIQITGDVVINREPALLLQLQQHDRGERFADRTYLKQMRRRDWSTRCDVNQAVSLCEQRTVCASEPESQARRPHGPHIAPDEPRERVSDGL